MFSGLPSGSPLSINTVLFCVSRYLCILSGEIAMKVGKNIHRTSKHCLKGFNVRGQRSRSLSQHLPYNDEGKRFDGEASRLTVSLRFSHSFHSRA